MIKTTVFLGSICTLASIGLFGQKAVITSNKEVVSLSAIRGTTSRVDTLVFTSGKNLRITDIKIEGEHATYFRILSSKALKISPNAITRIAFQFAPPPTFVGVARVKVIFRGIDYSVEMYGLSTQGLEGENEPPLSKIVEALGLNVDVGWNTLANHLRPELQGEELPPSLFKKADTSKVEMIPVARYSPDFLVNFGYYTNSVNGPIQHQAGILDTASTIPEHQTLFPGMTQGNASFDPGENTFGFYSISPEHTLYSEDIWNILFYPAQATRAVRIFPVKDNSGNQVPSTYLLCMEEAANGDYNDYVFLLKNINPVPLSEISLFNGKNLDGWYIWLRDNGKNNDPDKVFTVADGQIFDTGKDVGYIMTNNSFGNFHFTLEFKWGVKKWPPRENAKRDSGICYNIPEDETDKIWPRSIECQIQEGDVGDLWLLGYSTIQVDKKQNPPLAYSRIVKKKDAEKSTGDWNVVEVISFNGKCVHIVNGVVVHYGENASLIGGKILLQSEYAEVYYRNIKIRELQ